MTNLVVFCDGTWNTPEDMDRGLPSPTNVVKLRNATVESANQKVYYHPGVGTSGGWWDRIAGGGVGKGLDQNIMSAYRWLAGQYSAGDDIFLFGFSRGAYTVRSLGGLISNCGLLDLTDPELEQKDIWHRVESVFDTYRKGRNFTNPKHYPFHNVPADAETAKTSPIHFIGVWDTVGALGIPDDLALLGLFDDAKKHRFHDTALSDIVTHARHAVALDERRDSFAPTLWTGVGPPRVRQIWFPGAHSDVGGGYLEIGLSDGALEWMMDEAKTRGLKVLAGVKKQLNVDPLAVVHDSLTGVFKLLKSRPRSAPRLDSKAADLHGSVGKRLASPSLTQGHYWKTRTMQPGDSETVDVFAIEHWNATGLFLEAGETYQFVARGEWMDKDDKFSPTGRDTDGFSLGDVVRFASGVLGSAETAFRNATGRQSVDFWWTKRDEGEAWFALLGHIASDHGLTPTTEATGETFLIGDRETDPTFTPQASGYLYCFANDAWHTYGNNRGSVSLTVTRASGGRASRGRSATARAGGSRGRRSGG